MAEVVQLTASNIHEVAPDDILCFDGRYAEVESERSFSEGVKCMGMNLYQIISTYSDVRLVKRGAI